MADDLILPRLGARLSALRGRIEAACARAGRRGANVRLVVVTKYMPDAAVSALLKLGIQDLGESRVQQLVARAEAFAKCEPAPRWHMIGHLQRNKVKAALRHASIVHSVDSLRLAEEIEKWAAAIEKSIEILLEVNVSGETSKNGLRPDEVVPVAEALRSLSHVRFKGLMTMAPLEDDAEQARPHFARLRELLASLRRSGVVESDCCELSMGMSHDYAVAIEEGATLVRIGSALAEDVGAAV